MLFLDKFINPIPTRWADFKTACLHMVKWTKTGFRLFALNVRVSFKLLRRSLQGYPLSLRDRKLLVRTTADIGKIIPFSFFIIIPFAEILLPFLRKQSFLPLKCSPPSQEFCFYSGRTERFLPGGGRGGHFHGTMSRVDDIGRGWGKGT